MLEEQKSKGQGKQWYYFYFKDGEGSKINKYYINIIIATKDAVPCRLHPRHLVRKGAQYTRSDLDEETLNAILNASGKPVDAAQVKAVIEKLKGKQVHEVPHP